MTRYYFYSKDHRQEYKQHKVISFGLNAFYAEKAFSDKVNKEVTTFRYFDEVDVRVKTNVEGSYRFDFDHGVDGCHSHWATSFKELKNSLADGLEKFYPISEKHYFWLRRLAVRLMFRHTRFLDPSVDLNHFYYSNESGIFHDVELARLVHLPPPDDTGLSEEFKQWSKENIPERRIGHSENIKIFLGKKNDKGELNQSFRFCLEGNFAGADQGGFSRFSKYTSLEEALESVFFKRECKETDIRSYKRLRNYCLRKIWDHCELEISKLMKDQSYSVRILDL